MIHANEQAPKLPPKGEMISLNCVSSSSPSHFSSQHNQSHHLPHVHISNQIKQSFDPICRLEASLKQEKEQSAQVKHLLLEKIIRLEQRERMAQDEARKLNTLLQQLVSDTSMDQEQMSQLKRAVVEKQKTIDVLQDEVETQRKLRYQVSFYV